MRVNDFYDTRNMFDYVIKPEDYKKVLNSFEKEMRKKIETSEELKLQGCISVKEKFIGKVKIALPWFMEHYSFSDNDKFVRGQELTITGYEECKYSRIKDNSATGPLCYQCSGGTIFKEKGIGSYCLSWDGVRGYAPIDSWRNVTSEDDLRAIMKREIDRKRLRMLRIDLKDLD